MAFVQIIEYRTSRFDEIQAVVDELERATEGRRTVRRAIVTRDRKDPNRYLVLVFFDSYEDAMRNSELPETQQMAERIGAFIDAPPVFHDLDIVDDRS